MEEKQTKNYLNELTTKDKEVDFSEESEETTERNEEANEGYGEVTENAEQEKTYPEIVGAYVQHICRFQKLVVFLLSICVLYAIFYPVIAKVSADNYIDGLSSSTMSSVTELRSDEKIYYVCSNNYINIYYKNSFGEISKKHMKYSEKALMTLRSYFGENATNGKPPFTYVKPNFVPFYIVVICIGVITIVSSLSVIHKTAEKLLYVVCMEDEYFSSIVSESIRDFSSIRDGNKRIKAELSEKIIKNNKFYRIFRYLY